MKFSIITPTVQRQSLLDCCRSVDEQTLSDSWQHVVIVDKEEFDLPLMAKIAHPQRLIVKCGHPHRNGGNTPRHLAWEYATGEMLYMLDDDNFLNGPRVLEDIASALEDVGDAQWFLFPIFRHGSRFYFDPPQPCYFDTGNAVTRREIGRWPNIDGYASDAVWLEELKKYPYKAFPDAHPIMIMPTTSFGAGGGINGQ